MNITPGQVTDFAHPLCLDILPFTELYAYPRYSRLPLQSGRAYGHVSSHDLYSPASAPPGRLSVARAPRVRPWTLVPPPPVLLLLPPLAIAVLQAAATPSLIRRGPLPVASLLVCAELAAAASAFLNHHCPSMLIFPPSLKLSTFVFEVVPCYNSIKA